MTRAEYITQKLLDNPDLMAEVLLNYDCIDRQVSCKDCMFRKEFGLCIPKFDNDFQFKEWLEEEKEDER